MNRSPIISSRDEPQNIEQGMSNAEVNWAHSLPFDILKFKPPLPFILNPIPREQLVPKGLCDSFVLHWRERFKLRLNKGILP